jgi:hypothetical protein
MSDREDSMATRLLDDEPGLEPAGAMAADDEVNAPAHDQVAELAYSYWESRGFQGGSPWDDWFRAEKELLRQREL